MTKKAANKARRYIIGKILFNIILVVVGIFLISGFLMKMQEGVSEYRQRKNSEIVLQEVITTLSTNADDVEELSSIYHTANQETCTDIRELLTSGLFDSIDSLTNRERCVIVNDIIERSGVSYLLLIDPDGKVLLSPAERYIGSNLVEIGLMTEENMKSLVEGTRRSKDIIVPVVESNDTGEYYFYSEIIYTGNARYVLLLGTPKSLLDIQLESLRDVGAILKRAPVNNNGFMFAVDKEKGTFLYYENGDDVLTGDSISESGLNAEVMENGYAGIQRINGVEYYCVSQVYRDNTVVSAVAATEVVFNSDRYAIFWSVLGFVLVMLLCLTYAVIVRNDSIRNGTPSGKKKLFTLKNRTCYFDGSIFKKIVPLMIASILLIFVISFYTQTLLDIASAVDSSEVALKDVTGRYEKSREDRAVIRGYYESTFLSKARLLAYLLEEDPSPLNEDTDRYYTKYDENGIRLKVLDDEGNPLRSVRKSDRLARLCAENDISEIFVYDENGRTIATNTELWYFEMSNDETSQSYPFREVLDGKHDSLLQESQMNESGVVMQYTGVPFTYYTTVDAAGNTRYASIYEVNKASTAGRDHAYTKHRGLLQIGITDATANRLLASTEASYVLSTNILGDGFIMLIDADESHTVIYSPYSVQIGQPAKDIGITDKAFSGNYYGFRKFDGNDYFQYCVYSDNGYYVATTIPTRDMYLSRTTVALITSLISLLMIMILTATITLTTDEEEKLFRMAAFGENTNDVPIFKILMPSGHAKDTVSASARWDARKILWREKMPQQKLAVLFGIFFGILFLVVLFSIFGAKRLFHTDSIILYIISGKWDRGLNIFAISACGALLLFTALMVWLVRIPVRLVTSMFGTRSETVGHLLLSVIKYGSWIASIFFCLYMLGLESGSLLTSAGILSLVIGLGAQSMIQDIIAGIFIVFEGDFRVGDIITVDDFRGQVIDIGLRTTKVLNGFGNTKIYNNSKISGILNMTKVASVAVCEVSIEYGEDLIKAEEVLKECLPKIRKANRRIIFDTSYEGIDQLADSGVVLRIHAQCHEKDIITVKRLLNREVYIAFRNNGINFAFPSVTVYPPDEKYDLKSVVTVRQDDTRNNQ